MSHAEIRERAEEMKQALDNAEIGWPHGGMFDQFVEDVLALLDEVDRYREALKRAARWIEARQDPPSYAAEICRKALGGDPE